MSHPELEDLRESSPQDRYKVRIAPGYIGVTDLNKQEAKAQSKPPVKRKNSPTYNLVSTFSKKSRNRLIQDLNRLQYPPRIFVSLTFPPSHTPVDGHAFNTPLKNLARHIRRDFPESWFLWRMEPHKNDARPHFHLLGTTKVGGEPESVRSWFQQRWGRIIGVDHTKLPRLTNVARVYGHLDRLYRDFSKKENAYMHSVSSTEWRKAGRRWGRINANKIPYGDVIEREVTWELFREIRFAVLDHLQTEIIEMEAKLAACTPGQNTSEMRKLQMAVLDKQQFHVNVSQRHDFFAILNEEHIDLVKQTIRDWDYEQELRMLSGEPH